MGAFSTTKNKLPDVFCYQSIHCLKLRCRNGLTEEGRHTQIVIKSTEALLKIVDLY